jgi:O-antigen ligase
LVLARLPWLRSLSRGLVGLLAVYALICIASAFWSVYPAWTLYRSVEYLVDLALLAAVLASVGSTQTYHTLLTWSWTLYGALMASVWLGVLIWPQDALSSSAGSLGFQLNGVFPAVAANSVGELGAILGTVALARFLSTKQRSARAWWSLLLVISIITMVLAQGRSAIAGFVLGAILVLLFSKRVVLSIFLAMSVTAALSIKAVSGSLWEFLRRGASEQELNTLSSRVDWWLFAFQKFLERPLIGWGAYAAGRFVVMAGLHGNTLIASVHSEYVEILVGTGLLGIIPIIVVIIWTWRLLLGFYRCSRLSSVEREILVEVIGVMGVLTIRSFFTTELFWHPPLLFLAVLGYAELLRRQRMPRSIVSPMRVPSFADISHQL